MYILASSHGFVKFPLTGKKIYHKKLAELPFEEKIKISRQLAKIAKNIKER